jgi:hypothetical protein
VLPNGVPHGITISPDIDGAMVNKAKFDRGKIIGLNGRLKKWQLTESSVGETYTLQRKLSWFPVLDYFKYVTPSDSVLYNGIIERKKVSHRNSGKLMVSYELRQDGNFMRSVSIRARNQKIIRKFDRETDLLLECRKFSYDRDTGKFVLQTLTIYDYDFSDRCAITYHGYKTVQFDRRHRTEKSYQSGFPKEMPAQSLYYKDKKLRKRYTCVQVGITRAGYHIFMRRLEKYNATGRLAHAEETELIC